MKKILVTGATGFVGKHLINELSKQKDFEVIGLINRTKFGDKKIKFIRGNITNENLKLPKVDCIIHLAALKKGNEEEMLKVNIEGTENLLKKCKNIKHFIYISTVFVNAFESPYTETKRQGENIVKGYGTKYTILRLPHMYDSEAKRFFDSKFFIRSYKRIKELRGIKFDSDPTDVKKVSKKILKYILNKKYFNRTVVV